MENGKFCEDCPFANGADATDNIATRGFRVVAPNPGFVLSFIDNESNESNKIQVKPTDGSYNSTWARGTAREAMRRIDACEEPIEETVRRMGGILGTKAVMHCGAFPDQNPKHVRMKTQSSGY